MNRRVALALLAGAVFSALAVTVVAADRTTV